MNSLSIEEQLFHSIFCHQIQGIKIENAKQLLIDLHLVYLSQQAIISDLTTQQTSNDLN
ncbi:hypothetical protein [Chamaesiphon sp.]|uniref:hypothetical protein n=1 Tax=Chamaesiphon sp. TaxID=2814140 RepID=UPI003593C597